MANTDSFIDEVTEEVRNDRLYGYAKRYGWIVAAVLIALVAATAYFEIRSSQAEAEAQARGDAVLAALAADESEQDAALTALAENDTSIVMQLLAAQGDDAATYLTAVQNDPDTPVYIRDLASLRLAVLPDALPLEERKLILTTQSQFGQTYRSAALEYLVLLHIEEGETETALQLMQDAIKDASTDPAQVPRFTQLIVALGETPELAN